ncbi:hypothetical protein BC834DRAFT_606538 [Gloeopeniophorella convolvens]|nr:hypothetical protein BC834DRAFT_606538 [Gloeopeniophorella convolvens]
MGTAWARCPSWPQRSCLLWISPRLTAGAHRSRRLLSFLRAFPTCPKNSSQFDYSRRLTGIAGSSLAEQSKVE